MKHFWTPEDIQTLTQLYPNISTAECAKQLGRAEKSITAKAYTLGLRKTQAFLDSEKSGRIQRGKQDPRMQRTQFKPGTAPWNKGVKGSTGLHENCRKTQFKKGRPPEESRNYLPIGSLRITKDGYLEKKVTDDHPVPARRWVSVHRLVWEAANGPVPAGHIIVFKGGLRTTVLHDITPDRLECIHRKENARRNHPSSKHPELAKLIQLKGAITRQLNRITKESQTP